MSAARARLRRRREAVVLMRPADTAIVASMQVMILGVIGEYDGRIFLEAKRRPLYVVAETADRRDAGARAAAPLAGGGPD